MDKFSKPAFAEMCRIVASEVYDTRKPTPQYADRAARLLYMTAAHESDGFKARRQYGFQETSTRGAFSLFQLEAGSIMDSLKYLDRHPALKANAENVLQALVATDVALSMANHRPMLLWLQKPMWDPLAAILARLHYIRVTPTPIPATDFERAIYAKKWYNTLAGKATSGDYLKAYTAHFVKELGQ